MLPQSAVPWWMNYMQLLTYFHTLIDFETTSYFSNIGKTKVLASFFKIVETTNCLSNLSISEALTAGK